LAEGLHLLEIAELVADTHEVMLGVADLVIGVAVQEIGEETDRLHHGEQSHGISQLIETQLYIMKIRNRFTQWFIKVRELSLELSKCATAVVAALWSDHLNSHCVSDIDTCAPVKSPVKAIGFAAGCGHESQHFSVNVVNALSQHCGADAGHRLNIVLQQVDVLENAVVDPLQDIVGRISLQRYHPIGVVDETVTQRENRRYRPFDVEIPYNIYQFFIFHTIRHLPQ
jgi:hypothetical protein